MNKIETKRILVLGASGQIGCELLNHLNNIGCQITAVRSSIWETDQTHHANNTSFISCNLNDIGDDELENLISAHDYIFHLAGDTAVTSERKDELAFYLSWVFPLQKILNLIVNTNKRLIFASSATVYGTNPVLPVTNETRENPQTSYDLAKTSCDNLISFYRAFYKVNCVSLRFSNVYGPGVSVDQKSRRALNKMLNIIHVNKEITLVGDGSYSRNYIHVFDAAAMLIHAGRNILYTPPILLACSKENFTFKFVISELIEMYQLVFGAKVEMKFHLPESFITDKRSFSAEPSKIFLKDFEFKYIIRQGFEEIVRSL